MRFFGKSEVRVVAVGNGAGKKVATGDYSFPLREAPANEPERTEQIEQLVEKVYQQHGETLEKLADE